MVEALLGFTLPYWLVSAVWGALFIQTLWTLYSLRHHNSIDPAAKWFSLILWGIAISCAWGSLGDLATTKDRLVGANSLFRAGIYMAFVAWGYRQIIGKEALLRGVARWADNKAAQKIKRVSEGIPLNKIRITSETQIRD